MRRKVFAGKRRALRVYTMEMELLYTVVALSREGSGVIGEGLWVVGCVFCLPFQSRGHPLWVPPIEEEEELDVLTGDMDARL